MTKRCVVLCAVGLMLALSAVRAEDMTMEPVVVVTADTLAWGAAPPVLPAGAEMAVLAGDPGVAGAGYTMRFRAPAGYVVPPHWHPVIENVTVISGSILIGMGDAIDEAATQRLAVGEFFSMPAEHHHYALFDEATTIQLHGTGPFAIYYVNPADDPMQATAEE